MRIILLCILTGLTILWPQPVAAADTDETKLAVSPAISEWIVAPGQSVKKTFILSNTSAEYIPVQVDMRPMTMSPQEGEGLPLSAESWFSLAEPDFILKPNEAKKITIRINTPKNAEPGGHYATTYFRELSPLSAVPRTNVVGRVGVLHFVTVKGKVNKKLVPSGISVQEKMGKKQISIKVKNEGNVHAFPSGSVVVKDWWGNDVKRIPLPIGIVLPQTTRTYTLEWNAPVSGVYTAYTELVSGDQILRPLSVTIWSIPWIKAIFIFFVLFIGWFGIFRLRERWARAIKVLFR